MPRGSESEDRTRTGRLVALAVLVLVLVAFIAQNFSTVEVQIFGFHVRTRLAWALLAAGALGFVTGSLADRVRRR